MAKIQNPNRDIDHLLSIVQILIRRKHSNPELRIMQILGNAYGNIDPYYLEDDDVLHLLEESETKYGTN